MEEKNAVVTPLTKIGNNCFIAPKKEMSIDGETMSIADEMTNGMMNVESTTVEPTTVEPFSTDSSPYSNYNVSSSSNPENPILPNSTTQSSEAYPLELVNDMLAVLAGFLTGLANRLRHYQIGAKDLDPNRKNVLFSDNFIFQAYRQIAQAITFRLKIRRQSSPGEEIMAALATEEREALNLLKKLFIAIILGNNFIKTVSF